VATYRQFEEFVKSKYSVKTPKGAPKEFMALEVPCPNDRTHVVLVHPGAVMGTFGEFADVVAFLGEMGGAKLERALKLAMQLPVGGLVTIGDSVALRHSIPLADIDESEIASAILFTAMSADTIEAKIVGGDKL
jgi:hypothetical protein